MDNKYLQIKLISSNKMKFTDSYKNIIQKLKELDIYYKGPIFMPKQRKEIMIRKAPSGTGTATFDRFYLISYACFFKIMKIKPEILLLLSTFQKEKNLMVFYKIIDL